MRILLIGGNGFIGRFAVAALKQQGHALAVFHRGTTAVPAGVDEIRGDRNQLNASAQELKRFAPDVVIDLVISSAPQAEELMNIFRGTTRRVVMLSSIDVYRAVGIFARHGEWAAAGGAPYGRVGATALSASIPTRESANPAQTVLLGDRRLRQDPCGARGDERP
jgi:nucleoside-diphosphate-sugar epimerase